MVHFSECPTVAANCSTEMPIEMRDGTVEHFPVAGGAAVPEGAPAGHYGVLALVGVVAVLLYADRLVEIMRGSCSRL